MYTHLFPSYLAGAHRRTFIKRGKLYHISCKILYWSTGLIATSVFVSRLVFFRQWSHWYGGKVTEQRRNSCDCSVTRSQNTHMQTHCHRGGLVDGGSHQLDLKARITGQEMQRCSHTHTHRKASHCCNIVEGLLSCVSWL